MPTWAGSQYFSDAAREVKMADGEDVLLLANILLRNVDNQIFAGKGEVWTAASFHVFGGCLRERGDHNRQRDCCVAIHERSQRAAAKLAIDQRFVEGDGGRAAARMRRVGRELNRVLVAVNLLLENVRRHFCLPKKTLGDAAADVNDA